VEGGPPQHGLNEMNERGGIPTVLCHAVIKQYILKEEME